MAFRKILFSVLLIALFSFAMIFFGMSQGRNVNAPVNLEDDPRINQSFGEFSQQLDTAQERTESQLESFQSENPILSFGTLVLFAIVSAGKVFTDMITGFYNVTLGLAFDVLFGGDPAFAVVTGVIISILLISIIFLFWRVLKAGE